MTTTNNRIRVDRIKLIAEMARQNITGIELAEKSGVSRSSIQAMRSGKSCNRNTVIHVVRALGVPVSDIIEEE